MRRISALSMAMSAITACASDATESSDSSDSSESSVETTQAPTPTPPDAAPEPVLDSVFGEELIGRWAHYDVVAYQDDVLKTLIISFGFNDVAEVDGRSSSSRRSASPSSAPTSRS